MPLPKYALSLPLGLAFLLAAPRVVSAAGDDAPMFPKGTFDLSLTGSYGYPVLGDNETYYSPALSLGYALADNLTLRPTFTGHYVDTEAADALGGDFSINLRWHFAQFDRWTLFAEASPGLGYFDHRLPPPDGTRFNFALRAGVGATYKLSENTHLIGGVSLEHFSNAGLQGPDRHPGSNAATVTFGVLWTF